MITKKKCKGAGLARGYGCGSLINVRRFNQSNRIYGLGKSCGCYMSWLLNSEEGKKKVHKSTLKASETRLSLEKSIKKSKEEKGIAAALTLTKNVVHAAIRERDKGKPCVSCECQWNDSFQAGHCFAAGNYKSIRYDFFNINGQCEKCNLFDGGNETQYLINLPKIIGKEEFEKLKKRAENDKKFNKHWTKEELKQIRIEAKQLNK